MQDTKIANYLHAGSIINRGKWYMVSGNFIYSTDSRLRELTGVLYLASTHDRTEE